MEIGTNNKYIYICIPNRQRVKARRKIVWKDNTNGKISLRRNQYPLVSTHLRGYFYRILFSLCLFFFFCHKHLSVFMEICRLIGKRYPVWVHQSTYGPLQTQVSPQDAGGYSAGVHTKKRHLLFGPIFLCEIDTFNRERGKGPGVSGALGRHGTRMHAKDTVSKIVKHIISLVFF